MRILPTTALLAILIPSAALADECKDINFTLDAETVRTLELDVGAGYLNITGSQGDVIELRARACAWSKRQLDDMDVRHQRRGDTWVVETYVPRAEFSIFRPLSLFSNTGNRYIDLDISVPAGLVLDIEDGSGDIDIRDVSGTFRINDGSGNIVLRGLTGNVDIKDGSGDITVVNINGDVEIDDGSGNIDVNEVEGDVVIADDGSGDIRIQRIIGSVTVEEDGSGDIDVRDVQGDFTTGDTGSGSLRYDNIGGRVNVSD